MTVSPTAKVAREPLARAGPRLGRSRAVARVRLRGQIAEGPLKKTRRLP